MSARTIAKAQKKREIVGIRILTGDDRLAVTREVERTLGKGYEVFEGENLTPAELPSIFLGATLFSAGERKVLITDLGENKESLEALAAGAEEFLKTENEVVIWETKLDKRLAAVKGLMKAGVEVKEFKQAPKVEMKAVFNIYDLALRNGEKAVKELEKIEAEQDPYMFFGLMVSQALKKLEWRLEGAREKRAVRELGKIDMQMKSTGIDPWMLIKSFLIRLKTI